MRIFETRRQKTKYLNNMTTAAAEWLADKLLQNSQSIFQFENYSGLGKQLAYSRVIDDI